MGRRYQSDLLALQIAALNPLEVAADLLVASKTPRIVNIGHHHDHGPGDSVGTVVECPLAAGSLVADRQSVGTVLLQQLDDLHPMPPHLHLLDGLAVVVPKTHRRRPLVNIDTDLPQGRPPYLIVLEPSVSRGYREGGLLHNLIGGGGIRTPGTVSRTTVFKTVALNHSATPPSSNDTNA